MSGCRESGAVFRLEIVWGVGIEGAVFFVLTSASEQAARIYDRGYNQPYGGVESGASAAAALCVGGLTTVMAKSVGEPGGGAATVADVDALVSVSRGVVVSRQPAIVNSPSSAAEAEMGVGDGDGMCEGDAVMGAGTHN
jgi:hypothetical protein